MLKIILIIAGLAFAVHSSGAAAQTLSADEIKAEMLNRTILTRRFGLQIRMRYKSNGVVSAKTLLGTQTGTWRPKGNRVCTTFPSGPAKGTNCVSFRRTGNKTYQSSRGVRFSIVD